MEAGSDRVILDHYLIGDGSPGGLRTRQSRLPQLLIAAGYGRWMALDALREVEVIFREVFLDPGRVGVSGRGLTGWSPSRSRPSETRSGATSCASLAKLPLSPSIAPSKMMR